MPQKSADDNRAAAAEAAYVVRLVVAFKDVMNVVDGVVYQCAKSCKKFFLMVLQATEQQTTNLLLRSTVFRAATTLCWSQLWIWLTQKL